MFVATFRGVFNDAARHPDAICRVCVGSVMLAVIPRLFGFTDQPESNFHTCISGMGSMVVIV